MSHTLSAVTRWQGPDGWQVEPIRLQGTDCYRVRHHGYLVRYCTSLRELEELLGRHGVELGDLREVEDG